MAGPDIDLNLSDLLIVNQNLGTCVSEFENLGDTTDDVQDAVGRPAGDSRLRDKVGDFESGWDGNRETILDSLKTIHDHLTAIIDGFSEADLKMAGQK